MSNSPVVTLLDIIDEQRWDDLPAVLAEDCVIERPGSAPLVGLVQIDRFYRRERQIASGLHKVDRIVADAEAAACWGTFTGVGKDGRDIEVRFADTFLLERGMILRRTTYLHGSTH